MREKNSKLSNAAAMPARSLGHRIILWSRFFRLDEAIYLPVSLTLFGYLLGCAVNGVFDIKTFFALFVLGLIAGCAGFGMNNITGLETDKRDAAKRRYPLVTGEIGLKEARTAVCACFALVFALSFILSYGRVATFVLSLVAISSAIMYNLLHKKLLLSSTFLATTTAATFLFSYSLASTTLFTPLNILVVLFLFVLVVEMTELLCSVKDIEYDPISLARRLGVELDDRTGTLHRSKKFEFSFYAVRFFEFVLLSLMYVICRPGIVLTAIILFLFAAHILALRKVHHIIAGKESWNKEIFNRVRYLQHIFLLFIFFFVLSGVGGILLIAIQLLTVLLAYVVRKIIWGEATTPVH